MPLTGAQAQAQARALHLIRVDALRMNALNCAASLALPDAWLAAGFVRNAVWDDLHQMSTPLNDIDLVYFDPAHADRERDRSLERDLRRIAPALPWSVKNQARMHTRHGHAPYQSTRDAMGYWPEMQTAVAVRLRETDTLEGIACFGWRRLFNLKVEHNTACAAAVFHQRTARKMWTTCWPALEVEERSACGI